MYWTFGVDALRTAGMGATPARLVFAVCGAAGVLASLSGAVATRLGLRCAHLLGCLALGVALALLGAAPSGLGTALLAAAGFGVTYHDVIAVQGLWNAEVFRDRPAAGVVALAATQSPAPARPD